MQSELVAGQLTPRSRSGTGSAVRYRSLVWNFAQRDLKARFKGTALGWGWSLLLPLATLATYTLITHYIFRAKPLPFGDGRPGNYAVFLFVGLTGWGFFANAINTAIPALLGTGPLMKKIYFPSYAPVFGAVIGVIIQSGIEIALVFVVLAAFGNAGLSWLLFPAWALLFVLFSSSLALILSIANIYFRDLAHIVAVVLGLLFYATPILYVDTLISSPKLHAVVMANPLSRFIDVFRSNLYSLSAGSASSWVAIVAWTAACCALAWWVFTRYGRDLGEEV